MKTAKLSSTDAHTNGLRQEIIGFFFSVDSIKEHKTAKERQENGHKKIGYGGWR